MPYTVEQYLAEKKKNQPYTVDQYLIEKKADTGGIMDFLPEPVSSLAVPETRHEPTTIVPADKKPVSGIEDLMLNIPRFQQAPGLPEYQRILANLGLGGAEMTANMPAFILDMITSPEKILDMPKQIIDPAAKLAAALTVKGESPQATEFAEKTFEESKQHPEAVLMPLLALLGIGKGAIKAAKGVKGLVKGKKSVSVPEKPVAEIEAKPTEPVSPATTEFLESITKPMKKRAEWKGAEFERKKLGVPVIDEMLAPKKVKLKPATKPIHDMTKAEFNESGIVPEWGTRNQYYTKNPYKSQLDQMKKTKQYDIDVLRKAEQWELEQVLKDKPGFLIDNLKESDVIQFAKDNNLVVGRQRNRPDGALIVAKDEYNLRNIQFAKSGRELGLALGYEDAITPTKLKTHRGITEAAAKEGRVGVGIKDYPDLAAKYGKKPVSRETVKPKGKKPYEMTQKEYFDYYQHPLKDINVSEIKYKRGWFKNLKQELSAKQRRRYDELSGKDPDLWTAKEALLYRKYRNIEKPNIVLSDAIEAPSLFAKYPFLKKIRVYGKFDNILGKYGHGELGISLVDEITGGISQKKSLLHEITHAIQEKLGKEGGKSYFGEDIKSKEYLEYRNAIGEKEARSAEYLLSDVFDKSKIAKDYHRHEVKQALSKGKPVPESVLKDYPDLAKMKPKAVEPAKGEMVKPKLTSETGAVVNPMYEVSKLTSEMIEKAKTKPEIKAGVKQAKEVMIEHDRQIRRSESTSKLMERTFEKNVPDKARQELILHAIEQEHNPKYYNKLDTFEKGIVKWLDGELDKLDKFIKDNQVLDLMPKEKGIRHIFHWWKDPKTGQPFASKYGKFSKGLPQAKQRVIPTYEVGMKSLRPVTTNVGKIIGETWQSVMRSHQSREMFKTLYHVGAEKGIDIQLMKGKPTKPIRMIERWDQLSKQGLTEDYVRYDNPILDKAITFKSGDRLVTIKGAVGVRKELLPFVKAYIENPQYGKLSELNFAAKSLKLGFSLFHVQSLAMQELANWRMPYWNIRRGLKLTKELNPEMRLLHQEGLDLWKGYEDVGYQNKFFVGATKLGKAGNIATKPIELMRSFIFDVVQPGMKASFAHDKYVKGLPKTLKEGLTEKQWAREVVKMADGHFSHEHYKRSLLETNRWMVKSYFDPQSRKAWQAALLSPTWQREHLLVAKNVAKSFMPDRLIKKVGMEKISKTAKSEYRKYALGAIMMVGAVDLYNLSSTKSMDGKAKHIWQNPPGKGFAVRAPWNEPSYKTKSGKTVAGGAAYIRPLKSIYEVAEWAKDPLQKFIYKLSPMFSAIGQQFWPGQYRRYEKGWAGYPERAKDMAGDIFLPISAGQAIEVAKGKRDPLAAVFPFLGMPTSKVKKEFEKTTRQFKPPEVKK